jgi:hypothetical protein
MRNNITPMNFRKLFSLILICGTLGGCNTHTETLLVGAKIYEHSGSYASLFEQWNKLGINTGFCSQELISDPEFIKQARDHGISTFLIFPVFFNPEALAQNPELAAITQHGQKAVEEWVEFVCPSRKKYRQAMIEKARRLVRETQMDGISIDFIRHFVYWEKVYPDRNPASLPVTCFDSICLHNFQTETALSIPANLVSTGEKAQWIMETHSEEWIRWHCELITSMVEEIAEAVREENPEILVNIHLVPWTEEEFEGGRRRVAGQDLEELSKHTDLLSPMTYAHMVKQEPKWIHRITEEMYLSTGGKVIPSVQVEKAYLDKEFGLEEFRETITEALKPPSGGVILWSWERLIAEPGKVNIFQELMEAY